MNEQTNIPDNTEIDKALKEFEVKNTEQAQKAPETASFVSQKAVEGVQFETDGYKAMKFYSEINTPKVIQLVMKYSGLKEQKTAEYILLAFVVIAMGISLFLFFGGSSLYPKKSTFSDPCIEFPNGPTCYKP